MASRERRFARKALRERGVATHVLVRGFALAGVLLVLDGAGVARAEDPPASDPTVAKIVPPKMLPHPDVPYPDDAEGGDEIVLVVVVNADGSVRSAKASSGREPFAHAAEWAALAWKFEPAHRGDTAVAATIRVLVEFVPPTKSENAVDKAISEPKISPLPTPPARRSEVIDDIQVRGARVAPTVVTLGRGEIRQLPGAFGDPFRAIDVLPGVTPIVSGFPYYYIRGAPPSNVGYYVDGVRVPYLFHFGLGPGVIHPSMLERVDLYPGPFPAAWGRAAGAIVSGETTAPREKLFGEGEIRIFDAGAIVETPFANGKGHVLVGGRYAYPGLILSLVAPEVSLDYSDYNTRVTYDVSDRDRLTLFSFGAFDLAAQDKDGAKQVFFASEFHRADMRWDRTWGKDSTLRVAATVGLDRTRLEGKRFTRDTLLGLRSDLSRPVSDTVVLRTGVQLTSDLYDADLPSPYSISRREYEETRQFFGPRTDFALGGYGDVLFRFGRGGELMAGARVDLFGSAGDTGVGLDPRLLAKIPLSGKVRLLTAHGISHQPPAFPVPAPAIGIPGIPHGLQEVYQSSFGVEGDLPANFTASATVFRNAFRNVGDLFALQGRSAFDDDTSSLDGRAIGLELLARRRLTHRLGILGSYTLSRNTRFAKGRELFNGFDRPHVFNLALTFDLGRNWRAGTRFLAYTGAPRFEKTFQDLYGRQPNDANSNRTAPDRLPPFYRFDARLEKRWTVGKDHWISLVFEGLNVTGHKEVLSYQCGSGELAGGGANASAPGPSTAGACKENAIGPISIPSIGVEGGL